MLKKKGSLKATIHLPFPACWITITFPFFSQHALIIQW